MTEVTAPATSAYRRALAYIVAGVSALALFLLPAPAFAQTFELDYPELSGLLTTAVGDITTIVVGVAAGLVGLMVLLFAVRWVLRIARSGGGA